MVETSSSTARQLQAWLVREEWTFRISCFVGSSTGILIHHGLQSADSFHLVWIWVRTSKGQLLPRRAREKASRLSSLKGCLRLQLVTAANHTVSQRIIELHKHDRQNDKKAANVAVANMFSPNSPKEIY